MFDDKTFLIAGGTVSFGQAVVRKSLETIRPAEVVIFDQDESGKY